MGATYPNSNLKDWIARLREADPEASLKAAVDAIDREALDSAVGFVAEHTRRYIASDGADDGWDGPKPILVLYTTGRRSGQTRRNAILYFEPEARPGERYLIGSKGGDDHHPEWYLNLVADPRVHLRVGPEVYEAEATTVTGAPRAELWAELVRRYPMFGDYQAATSREIPVVALRRVEDT